MSAGSAGTPEGALAAKVTPVGPAPRWAVLGTPLAALVAAGLAIGAATVGKGALAAVLIVEQAVLAWAWVRALGASAGTVVLGAAAGIIADTVLLASDHPHLGSVAGVIGVSVAVVVLYQLGRRHLAAVAAGAVAGAAAGAGAGPAGPPRPPVRVTADMASALGGIVLAVLLGAYLALRVEPDAPHPADLLVVAGLLGAGGAVVVGRLVGLAPVPPMVAALVGALAGAGAGAAVSAVSDRLPAWAALAMAAAGAVAAAVVNLGLIRARAAEPPDVGADQPGPVRPAAGLLLAAVLPLAVAAPLVYVVGRHLPT